MWYAKNGSYLCQNFANIHVPVSAIGVLLSTHHLDEAEVISDKVCILHQGKLLYSGSPLYLKEKFSSGHRVIVERDGLGTGAEGQYPILFIFTLSIFFVRKYRLFNYYIYCIIYYIQIHSIEYALTHKAPPIIRYRRQFQILLLFRK